MVTLDYILDPEDLQRANEVDMATATDTELEYYLFCGSIIFRADSASFDALWEWIPVFDFAIRIYEIVSSLGDGEESRFEFTECDDSISFARTGAEVRITATYTPSVASVPLDELREAAADLLQKVKDDLLSRFPALAENSAFKERLALVGIEV